MARHCPIKTDGVGSVFVKSKFRRPVFLASRPVRAPTAGDLEHATERDVIKTWCKGEMWTCVLLIRVSTQATDSRQHVETAYRKCKNSLDLITAGLQRTKHRKANITIGSNWHNWRVSVELHVIPCTCMDCILAHDLGLNVNRPTYSRKSWNE